MSAGSLTQYFRSFLIKLCMIEAQLGQMKLGGEALPPSFNRSNGEQMKSHSLFFWSCGTLRHHLSLRARLVISPVQQTSMLTLAQDDPPPWIPADTQHTTAGVSEQAELFMIRAVNTGVINVCFLLPHPRSPCAHLRVYEFRFPSPSKNPGRKFEQSARGRKRSA